MWHGLERTEIADGEERILKYSTLQTTTVSVKIYSNVVVHSVKLTTEFHLWHCQSSGGYSQTSHRGGPGSIPGQFI
jgi:hypothetical protein